MQKLIFILFLLTSSISAIAADAVNYSDVPASPNNSGSNFSDKQLWSGPYFGVNTGVNFFKYENMLNYTGQGMNNNYSNTISKNAPVLGGFGGFNLQSNNIVYGVEGDVAYSWNKANSQFWLNNAFNVKTKNKISASARLRAGYAFDKALIYGTVGWAVMTTSTEGSAGPLGASSITKNNAFNSVTFGGGIDYAITDSVFTRVGYRYTPFQGKNFDINQDIHMRINPKSHLVTAGLGVKF
ncbi:outer membrane protein [Liberibacter crescens BT-1]|uniref:Outer membrane protein n=1 Tax=Liberibacter crescens (strain BT-1) TaxID=1215343 RepID=L0EST0_LIBCB|nr:outer membrane beta-barrel protein [Liberibacter crescens]AGA64564.1 outer membrane protein [Liberibacter crescens BT-1]